MPKIRLALPLVALCATVLATTGCGPQATSSPRSSSSPPSSSAPAQPSASDDEPAQRQLDELTIALRGTLQGYEREMFPHWSERGGCSTRELVLKRSGTDVRVDSDCYPVSGSWVSPYDGKTWTDPSDLDIDHVVALAAAWRSGADEWSETRREAFANDLTRPQLKAVTDNLNQSKSDAPPEEWKPPLESRWCPYSKAWITVKHHWDLTVTAEEKVALSAMLEHC